MVEVNRCVVDSTPRDDDDDVFVWVVLVCVRVVVMVVVIVSGKIVVSFVDPVVEE